MRVLIFEKLEHMKQVAERDKDIKPHQLERTFLLSFLWLALIGDLIVFVFEIIVTEDITFIITDILVALFFGVLIFFIDRISLQNSATFLVFVLATFITIQSIYTSGWGVELLSTALIALGIFASLMLHNQWKNGLLIYIFLLIVVLWYHEIYSKIDADGKSWISAAQQSIPFFLIYWITLIPASILKNRYIKQQIQLRAANEEIQDKHEEITMQHHELLSSHEALADLNKRLEEIVAVKSSDVLKKNKRLLEHAFTHSHIVRGHTARLAGLFNLIEIDGDSKGYYWEKIEEEVKAMQKTIEELGVELYKDVQENEGVTNIIS